MKNCGAKVGGLSDCAGNLDRTYPVRLWLGADLRGEAKVTPACRDLKDAVGIVRTSIVMIRGRMVVIVGRLMRRGKLLEEMMDPVGL